MEMERQQVLVVGGRGVTWMRWRWRGTWWRREGGGGRRMEGLVDRLERRGGGGGGVPGGVPAFKGSRGAHLQGWQVCPHAGVTGVPTCRGGRGAHMQGWQVCPHAGVAGVPTCRGGRCARMQGWQGTRMQGPLWTPCRAGRWWLSSTALYPSLHSPLPPCCSCRRWPLSAW